MMFNAYILKSDVDNSYYVGQTDNLDRRLEEHNRGKNNYTKNKSPWRLVRKEFFNTRAKAMKRESEIKNKKSSNYIKWLISLSD